METLCFDFPAVTGRAKTSQGDLFSEARCFWLTHKYWTSPDAFLVRFLATFHRARKLNAPKKHLNCTCCLKGHLQ